METMFSTQNRTLVSCIVDIQCISGCGGNFKIKLELEGPVWIMTGTVLFMFYCLVVVHVW